MHTLPLYKNPSLSIDRRVEDLLSRMTLEEKIAQLYQIWARADNIDEVKAFIRRYGVGSRILAGSNLAGSGQEKALEIEEINEYQRIAVEESRLGIPILFGRDVIHGYRTIFPIPLGMAATFNPDLVEQAYTIAAREASSSGVNWSFAPMLDIARDPRWGRIAEGSGEDPYLASQMARAAVLGFQGKDLSDPERILACAKHYIGYGGAEGGRDYNTAEITDVTLRNIYLPPFKAAVDAGVGSVMSAFLDINGEPASGSHYLLTELLKGELGFTGFVISDWASVSELVHHRVVEDERGAARLAFTAGVDMEMVTQTYITHLKDLVESGEVSLGRIDDAVQRILTMKFRLGLFEHPYADATKASQVLFSPSHQQVARQIARESIVLLKNQGNLLPLKKSGVKIAVMGPLVNQRKALLGSWTLDGLLHETQTIAEAMQQTAPDVVRVAPSDALQDEMLTEAMKADVITFFAGESDGRSGENHNVASIDLPAGQEELIEAIARLGKPLVVVVFAGRPLNLSRVAQYADAILYAWHPGSLGAAALADLLFGEDVPSGKLPASFPRTTGQIPIHYNFNSTGRSFSVVGETSPQEYAYVDRYLDVPGSPLYPFGFGLSYTTFSLSGLSIDRPEIHPDEVVCVSVQVTNTGPRPGTEVIQCYVQDCVASITRPVRELKGFTRVHLQPGESQIVTFQLGAEELSFYGTDRRRHLEPGAFKVWVGTDSTASLGTTFRVIKS